MSKPKKDDRLSNPESYELPDALQKQAKALLEARRDLVFIPGQNEVGDDGAEESADDEDDDPEARGDTLNSLRPRAFLRLRSDVEDDIRAKYPECRWGEKRLRTLAEHRLFTIVRPGFWAKKQDLAPAVTAGYEVPLWEDIDQGVLHLAYMRRPHMLWLLRTLGQRTNGAPAYTSLAAACVLHTGTSRDEPHLLKARKVLLTGIGQSSFDIAYGFPVYVKSEDDSRLDEGTTTGSMRRVINCSLQQMNAEVVVHANVAAFREMKERVDAGLQSREVKVGEVCAIDGQFLKADVNVDGKRTNFADLIKELQPSHGPLLGYEFVKKEHRVGRKRVAITCVRTRRALVWTYINGSAKEHTVVEYLIRLLFRLWPECPIRVLVGDKAYDLKRAVHAFLLFNCGIWPVFYQRKGYALRWPDKVFKPYCDGKSGVRGVPLCPQAHGLMQLVDTAGHELTPEKRI
ncbi:MAG: hypothetical protein JWM31_1515, partial [Solirubrobacterales bacterium]|nr:hypothetical protein [Solirubrobacterales bacterium]